MYKIYVKLYNKSFEDSHNVNETISRITELIIHFGGEVKEKSRDLKTYLCSIDYFQIQTFFHSLKMLKNTGLPLFLTTNNDTDIEESHKTHVDCIYIDSELFEQVDDETIKKRAIKLPEGYYRFSLTPSKKMTRESQEEALRRHRKDKSPEEEVSAFVKDTIKDATDKFGHYVSNGQSLNDILSSLSQTKINPLMDFVSQSFGGIRYVRSEIRKKQKGSEFSYPEGHELFVEYKKSQENKFVKRHGLTHRLGPYVGISALLVFLNVQFSSGFPWSLIPVSVFSIDLLRKWVDGRSRKKELKELSSIKQMSNQDFYHYYLYTKSKKSLLSHGINVLSLSAFLMMINIITTSTPWSIIPAAVLGISFLGRMGDFIDKRKRKENHTGSRISSNQNIKDLRSEAIDLQKKILKHLKKSHKDKVLDREVKPLVTKYIDQITKLLNAYSDIDVILRQIDNSSLMKDKVILEKKLQDSTNKQLQKEYEKSITEIDRQILSLEQLSDHRELVELRVKSAVNNLNQMNIDLIRLRNVSEIIDTSTYDMLRQSSLEMSEYIDDYSRAFDDINK